MFNINLDKIIVAINRLAAAVEEATLVLKTHNKGVETDVENTLKHGYEVSKYAIIMARPLEDGRYAVSYDMPGAEKVEEKIFATAKEATDRFFELEKEKEL